MMLDNGDGCPIMVIAASSTSSEHIELLWSEARRLQPSLAAINLLMIKRQR